MILNLYLTVLTASFICSLLSFRLHYPYHLRVFSVLLGLTVLTEIFAVYLAPFITKQYGNLPIYNLFMLFEYLLIAYYFGEIISSQKVKKAIKVFFILFPVFWLCTEIFFFGWWKSNTYAVLAGDLFCIIFAARYLYELFTADQMVDFQNCSEFWIAAGIMFYSCCELPITGIVNFWSKNYHELTLKLFSVLDVLNIIMYSIFAYAFLCRLSRTITKY